MSRIAAIIVTYGAKLTEVRRLLKVVGSQVAHVILVDNGSPSLRTLRNAPGLHIIRLDQNYGLAYAQNIGIERAITLNMSHVLFLDQDSLPYPDMVKRLDKGLRQAKDQGVTVATAGPVTEDSILGTRGFFVKTFLGVPYKSYINPNSKKDFIKADFMISSGSLVPLSVINTVGGYRSDYFIDHLDTEWSARSGRLKFQSISVRDACMHHRIGEGAHRFWLLGWRTIFYHQPLRHYYIFRNTFLMMYDNPFNVWQVFLLLRLLKLMIYFLIFIPDRFRRMRFMLIGIKDGLLNRRGMLDPKSMKLQGIPKTSLDPR